MSTAELLLKKKGGTVVTVDRETSVADAARIMNDHHIGALIVVSGEQALGIFTERDILCRVVAARRDAAAVKVEEVMTTPMACCTRQTGLAECRAVMTENKIRHLPVVEDGTLFGMISSGDILANEVTTQERTIRYLNDYLYGRT